MPVQVEDTDDYKTKYRNLKRNLKMLIYENECFQEELRKSNRALLRVRQDKSFLLDQLLAHRQPPIYSSDSDLTDNSDTEAGPGTAKRKRLLEVSNTPSAAAAAAPATPKPSFPHQPTLPTPSTLSRVATTSGGKLVSKQCVTSSSKPSCSGNKPVVLPSAGNKRGVVTGAGKTAGKQTGSRANNKGTNNNKQRRLPHKLQKSYLQQAAGSSSAADSTTAAAAAAPEPQQLSREEVERHLLARHTIADFNTPVSLTLPHQLFSDNIMDGDLFEEIETSPSNMEDHRR